MMTWHKIITPLRKILNLHVGPTSQRLHSNFFSVRHSIEKVACTGPAARRRSLVMLLALRCSRLGCRSCTQRTPTGATQPWTTPSLPGTATLWGSLICAHSCCPSTARMLPLLNKEVTAPGSLAEGAPRQVYSEDSVGFFSENDNMW